MADILISIAFEFAKTLVNPAIRQGRYLFCASKFTGKLLQRQEELELKLKEVKIGADQATKNTQIIGDKAKTWMDEVTNVLGEVKGLEREMETSKCCHQGWCPTWRRYRLCKQMEEKSKIMMDFIDKCPFVPPFSHPAPLPGIKYESSEDFTYFESTKRAFDQLFEALQDDSSSMIGLYGMGGSGKTTLVTEVGKKAEESKLFNLVLIITVSQIPNIRSIQGKMADMLRLKLEGETEEGRAQHLSLRLKKEEPVLVIMDDVWEEFNLKNIGIELNKNNKGSQKVLLTTRRQQVCSLMNCGQSIPLGLLSEAEAWELFRKYAAMGDQTSSTNLEPELEHVAQKVARECKRLPIAIKAVASSLKGKSNKFQLKVALHKLKDSKGIDVDKSKRVAFSCLKLSFDYLEKEAKLLFFMCAMFPEDYEISVEDLIRYGVGLGVCEEDESFDFARSYMRVTLDMLLESCLLEETSGMRPLLEDQSGRSHVKMHDMVRDLAFWMASKEDHPIKVNLPKDVNSLVGDRDAKDCFTISRKFQETGHQLDAPKLEVLILNTDPMSLNLSNASFEGMEGLKVLAMINQFYSRTSLLPQSIRSLSYLRTLRLHGWELGDMSFIISMERLEVLDLQRCRFKEVPNEIEKLSKLKLLDLTDCLTVENYNFKTVERCSQLEELYVSLITGSIYFWQCCAHYSITPNLRRYKLKGGKMFDFEYIANEHFPERMRTLCLERLDYSSILQGCKNIVPDMDHVVGGLGDLTGLCLKFCFQIENLIDATSELPSFQVNALFDRLIKLKLEEMENLKEVCRGAPPPGFFKRLEELHINKCQQLHSIFPPQCRLHNLKILSIYDKPSIYDGTNCMTGVLFSMLAAQSLQKLEELTVEHCPELRRVIADVGEDNTRNTGEEISPALCNFHPKFPSLKKLRVCNCPKLEFIFPISCVSQDGLLQLEKIEVVDAGEMKYVFGQYDHAYNLSHGNKVQVMLPRLQIFELKYLKNLLGICPDNYHTRLPSLKELHWINCPKLVTLWKNLELGQHNHKMEIDYQKHLSFQYLQSLKLDGFTTLKSIFSMVILRGLSELKFLIICNCDELVEIIAENEEHTDLIQVEVYLPKLEGLIIKQCNKLKSLLYLDMIKDDDTIIEKENVLPNLSTIQLGKLPNFVNICHGFMFHKLKLQEVHIDRCPKFAPILGATQMIHFHHRTEEKVGVWDITINQLGRQEMLPAALQAFLNIEVLLFTESRVEGIFQLQVESKNAGQNSLKSNLQKLFLRQLPELRFIWGCSITVLEFHRLNYVNVKDCPKLKTIFPPGVVGSLQSLQQLHIRQCQELEEIIASSDLQPMRFPKLQDITVKKCDKLKYIFSDYRPSHFPQLSKVCIYYCCEMERVFGHTRVADDNNDVVFIELLSLELLELPNLTEIGRGIQLKTSPFLYDVHGCPNYTC